MNPGIYNIGGSGLTVSGAGQITANGVLLYLSGTGGINLTASGAVAITPVNAATYPQYAGIAVFQDRADTASDTFSGAANFNVDGAIYLPSGAATVEGSGGTFGAELIANTVTVTGGANANINFANGTKPQIPSQPALVQ
jgi:hypothetical protein